ncbi:MAG TPA: nucleotidyltransferase domain-containing protein [bacterium]|jgi:hypothetical protein
MANTVASQANAVLAIDLSAFLAKWKITSYEFFGSVIREDFRPDSDVDILVTYAPDSHRTLSDLMQMDEELAAIFGRKVDIVERKAVEESPNYIRRKLILEGDKRFTKDDARLLDILFYARDIRRFAEGATVESFESEDSPSPDAIAFCMSQISRRAATLTDATRSREPRIDWTKLAGLHERMQDEHFNLDKPFAWVFSTTDVPNLIHLIEPLVPPED